MPKKEFKQEGRVNMRLMKDLKAQGKKRAAELGVSFSEFIRRLLEAELSH